MKTVVALTAVLPALAAAQPHGHGFQVAHRGKRQVASQAASSASASASGAASSAAVSGAASSASDCSVGNFAEAPEDVADGVLAPENGCVAWHTIEAGDGCSNMLEQESSNLTVDQFIAINPSALNNCWGLVQGRSFCVGLTDCVADGVMTLEQNCTSYAQAQAGDTHESFAEAQNITLDEVWSFNENAGEMVEGMFYCISNDVTTEYEEAFAARMAAQDQDAAEVQAEEAPPVSEEATPAAEPTPSQNQWQQNNVQPDPAEEAGSWEQPEQDSSTWEQQEDTNTWEQQETNTWEQQETNTWEQQAPEPSPEPTAEEDNSWVEDTVNNVADAVTGGSNSGSGGGDATGDGTFYQPGLGSCGWTNTADDLIAAAPAALYDILGDTICGQMITVSHGGNSVQVQIADKCPECSTCSMDLSPAAFRQLASESEGRIDLTWPASALGFDASQC